MLPQQGGLWDSTGLCCSLQQSLVPGVQAQELPQGLAWTAAPWLGKSPANNPGHCPGSPGVGLEHLGLLHLRRDGSAGVGAALARPGQVKSSFLLLFEILEHSLPLSQHRFGGSVCPQTHTSLGWVDRGITPCSAQLPEDGASPRSHSWLQRWV